jgi:hypothetical protein
MKFKNHLNVTIVCVTVIISFLIGTHNFKNRSRNNDTISVTGLGRMDFKSDLIVWNGQFGRNDKVLESAFKELKRDKELVEKFLINQGVKKEEIVFSSIDIEREYKNIYNKESEYVGQEFSHFQLSQNVAIESKEVEKIEEVSRSVTELINEGIVFYSSSPQYYYTKLAELKLNLIDAATIDARLRADKIVENAKAEIGDLYDAKMGIFQIIEQNSSEEHSWGGTFNTYAKMKTATITMKLTYGVD